MMQTKLHMRLERLHVLFESDTYIGNVIDGGTLDLWQRFARWHMGGVKLFARTRAFDRTTTELPIIGRVSTIEMVTLDRVYLRSTLWLPPHFEGWLLLPFGERWVIQDPTLGGVVEGLVYTRLRLVAPP